MNFVFSNPLFLFGLAAGVLPILIHRLIQRKAVPRNFSAVRLLLKSERIMARPQRLKHILLLALRVLAVVSLVLLMARPVMMPEALLAMAQGGGKVLILDNSLSMGFREERGVRYGLARKAAKQVIEAAGGQIMIIPTAPPPLGTGAPAREVRWMPPEEAIRELDAIALSPGRGDPGAALELAYGKLKDFQGPKEILVLSDMARRDWDTFDLAGMSTVSAEAGIHFLRIGGTGRDANFTVNELKLAEGDLVSGVASRIEVTVMNFSDLGGSPLVQLYLGGAKIDQKRVELKAGEEGKIYFDIFPDRPGWMDGEIKLSGDSLSGDDVFYSPLNVRDRVKVLLVDGDPGRSLKGSESYYLFQALAPGGAEGSPFLTRVVTEGELAGTDLRPYEALFLLNAASPPGSKLASFLESGKPVFLFLGDRVSPDEYNRIPLFPWRLKEIRGGKGTRIAGVDSGSKSLRFFAGSSAESLKKASVHQYYRIEGAADPLLKLETGDPLLVRANLGKGALYLFASSANLDWTDLPLKAAYLPLVQGLLKEAVGLSPDSLPASFRFGEPLEEKSPPAQVWGNPGGPGIYEFFLASGGKRRGLNPPLEESDLSKVSQEEMQKRFGTIPIKMLEYKEEFLSEGVAGKKELWPFLLSFLLVVLAAEMGVASRL
jgi:hypothetical protein